MATVGIRELKERTSTILRRVRDRGEEVQVTFRGRVVARIVPVARSRKRNRKLERAVWCDIDRVAEEIGAVWPKGVTAARAVREARRG
jgi:prevent-host-death family protein